MPRLPLTLMCALLALTPTSPAMAQAAGGHEPPNPSLPVHWPFAVGERMEFQGKFGWLPVGRAESVVEARDTVRGHETFRIRFSVNGGPSWFGVHDNYTSWFDARTLVSYRYHQDIHEGRYSRNTTYEIIPESGIYVQNGKDTAITVAAPLDDEAFIYFIRTLPLTVGAHYEWNRYFKADRNPVVVDVVRRETVSVPAGTFTCVVLKPTIKANGLFSEGGHAEVWVSDDDRRLIVQMKSGLSFGSLNLYLKKYTPGDTARAARPGGS